MAIASDQYYKVFWSGVGDFGVAMFTESTPMHLLPEKDDVLKWSVPEANLENGVLSDYPPSNRGVRLCSPVLMETLGSLASPKDRLQWLEVKLNVGANPFRYWILHFPAGCDVLNERETLYQSNSDSVIKPVLSPLKANGHHVFSFQPKQYGPTLIVSAQVKEAMKKAKITGIEFGKCPVR